MYGSRLRGVAVGKGEIIVVIFGRWVGLAPFPPCSVKREWRRTGRACDPPFETVLYRKEGDIAEIALNRPRVLNAYNVQMRDDMSQALEAMRDVPEVHCVVLFQGESNRAEGIASFLEKRAPTYTGE